jgi:large subunit ribosomal protein L24
MNIKKNDNVKILKGKDRGKTGKVLRTLPREGKVVVEAVNLRQKSVRPKQAGEKGQQIKIAVPIAVANVVMICPACSQSSRVGYRKSEKENKERYCKKCNATV